MKPANLALEVDGWLAELGLEPVAAADREGIHSRDLVLDGRRRKGVRLTVIIDRELGIVCLVHYAPPLADSLRKVYRQLLQWNDELPFVKFALGANDQPVLSDEVPATFADGHVLGLTVARLLAVCDLLYAESARWVDRIRTEPAPLDTTGVALLERYASELGELSVDG